MRKLSFGALRACTANVNVCTANIFCTYLSTCIKTSSFAVYRISDNHHLWRIRSNMQREGVHPEYPLPYFSSGYPYGCPPRSAYVGCLPPFHHWHYQTASIQSPRDAPSNCNSCCDSEDEPLSSGSSQALFRPLDFDNCKSTTAYYSPTPSDSDNSSVENEATSSPCIESSISKTAISVSLVQEEMWEAFRAIGNEMIVTKPGR